MGRLSRIPTRLDEQRFPSRSSAPALNHCRQRADFAREFAAGGEGNSRNG